MDYFPVFLKLTDAPCLVVGGGAVAERKISLLLKAGARVTVVAPKLIESLSIAKDNGHIVHREALFNAQWLEGQILVVAASNDLQVNKSVAKAAKEKNIPVNTVDQPSLCSFCLLYTSPSPRDRTRSRMPSSA